MSAKVKDEVALVWGAALAGVNAAQLAAVSVPSWAHIVILVGTATLAALGIRARVTPV